MTVEDSFHEIKQNKQPTFQPSLQSFGIEHCRPVATPFPARLNLVSSDSFTLMEATPYSQLVGVLMHLANTVRPDITFAMYSFARLMHSLSNHFRKAG